MIDPISIALLVGGAIVGAVVATYWDELRVWIKQAYDYLAPVIKETCKGIISAIKWVGMAMASGLVNVARFFSFNRQTREWQETIVTQTVDESKVPEHIRQKLQSQMEVDTTEEVAKELDLKLV